MFEILKTYFFIIHESRNDENEKMLGTEQQ